MCLALLNNNLSELPKEEYVRKTAGLMARIYHESINNIVRSMNSITEETQKIQNVFGENNYEYNYSFSISFSYCGQHTKKDPEEIELSFRQDAWKIIIGRLGIKSSMSIKARDEFEKQLNNNNLPEINEENIVSMIFGLVDQANDFAKDAGKEVFEILRPYRSKLKTNNVFKIGRKVILSYYVDECYGMNSKFRVEYWRQKYLIAIDNMFHLLDGKRTIHDGLGPLCESINKSEKGVGETEYFKYRCFKNKNLHLEFKRLDLVKQINFFGMGENVLGESDE